LRIKKKNQLEKVGHKGLMKLD